eukprot:5461091-Amphidinium_carterae.1
MVSFATQSHVTVQGPILKHIVGPAVPKSTCPNFRLFRSHLQLRIVISLTSSFCGHFAGDIPLGIGPNHVGQQLSRRNELVGTGLCCCLLGIRPSNGHVVDLSCVPSASYATRQPPRKTQWRSPKQSGPSRSAYSNLEWL